MPQLLAIESSFPEEHCMLRFLEPPGSCRKSLWERHVIALGFKERRPEIDWERFETTAADLKRCFGLDFPRYVRRLALDWKLRRWHPAFA